ncbi:hypothetical protein [Porphyrobacter sp. LM 6]|uniref:hypothetical protein n=1 Tax=Porphyrobacter sp. LM 6 TaxID=1896196 RepID=UPI000863B6CE|nr:hypothetical protein [Porphyrobacter sp. LM 6]AOL93739.1 hypothetical protein BG023_11790 [Porphyrobacter sp. LM 6]
MTRNPVTPSTSIGNGLILSAICLVSLASLLAYTNAARGVGHWHRLDDPAIWAWMVVAAAMFGFWGYLSIVLGATRKTALGRRLFTGIGLAYLVVIGLSQNETFSHDSVGSIVFQAFLVPAISTVVMGPLLLLFAWIGNAYGKPDYD